MEGSNLYHVTRIDDTQAAGPADYAGHAKGFRRQDLIGRDTGSHQMSLSNSMLDPGGWIAPAVHSYEKSIWIFEGELRVSMLGQTVTLRPNDCAVVPVGVTHQLSAAGGGARWLEMSAPVRLQLTDHRRDTFFLDPGAPDGAGPSPVDLRDPRNKNYFRFDESSMDLGRLSRGSDPAAPEVSASMATALLVYSGISIRMLADQRISAQMHTMFVVDYQPTATAHPHDHPFEEAYVFTRGRTDAVVNGDELTMRPGDVLWAASGCDHAFYNRTDERTQWLETQAPQPPAQHSYRFNRDWSYLGDQLSVSTGKEGR